VMMRVGAERRGCHGNATSSQNTHLCSVANSDGFPGKAEVLYGWPMVKRLMGRHHMPRRISDADVFLRSTQLPDVYSEGEDIRVCGTRCSSRVDNKRYSEPNP
jgi:hypothetical protein